MMIGGGVLTYMIGITVKKGGLSKQPLYCTVGDKWITVMNVLNLSSMMYHFVYLLKTIK